MAGTPPMPGEVNPRRIVQAVRELFEGRSNAVGTVTLTPNASTTTVTAIVCGLDSRVMLTPITPNAAAEIGNGTMYVSNIGQGVFTITHDFNAQTDRIFHWSIQG